MGSMKAVITDPLKPTGKYVKARDKVERKKARLQKAKRKARRDGVITPEEQARIDRRTTAFQDAKQERNSIKNKYSDKRANVVEFDTRWMLDKVKEILSPNHALNQAWELLHESNNQLNTLLDRTNNVSEAAANSQPLLQQDAMRMSLLLGAPLPEKAADHVLIGDQRQEVDPRDRGRRSLRIDVSPASSLEI